MKDKCIYVTKPFLPPLEELLPYLQKIWDSRVLTNIGPFHQELEEALCKYLGVDYLCLFSNGTLALITALQALRVAGEVITTPYSFVATAHSLIWNGIKPIFIDIDAKTLNINPDKIEAAITPQTTAILPVHCYGHPCDCETIQAICDNYDLKLIYDSAHAFGVRDAGGSILRYGDLSILSFHATKVYNTFEGGAIICHDEKTKIRIDRLKNFGHAGETTVVAHGSNGKMSEFNAALGLVQLKHIDKNITQRQEVDRHYRLRLDPIKNIRCLKKHPELVANHAYFPILVEDGYSLSRDALCDTLRRQSIFPRRYFFPLISEFPMYKGFPSAAPDNLPVATAASRRILCLPIYPDLEISVVDKICNIIEENQ